MPALHAVGRSARGVREARPASSHGPTFSGGPPIQSDDLLLDPRYAKTGSGMTPGHLPVRSYLAVSVVSRSGEVIGGLSFGHPETGVFSERVERIIVAIAAQAAVGIDNARLYDAPAAPLGNGKICSRPSARSARLAAAAKGNGSVRVTSPGEGQGATFTVQLPVLLLHPIAGEPSDPSREPSSPPSRFASLDRSHGRAGARGGRLARRPRADQTRARELPAAELRTAGSADEGLRLRERTSRTCCSATSGCPTWTVESFHARCAARSGSGVDASRPSP